MSPQFVDYDSDGRLDIVAGIFDGSPHLARGSDKGFCKPEQILDRGGARIVLNAFWNFDTKKWDSTNRCDGKDHEGEGHLTSAVAYDWDGDGDLDLLLGDYRSGRVFRRMNEGTAQQPAFATVNELVHAGGQPIDVPGNVATLRLVDWNKDGRLDLACGSMGNPYTDLEGGGVVLFLDTRPEKGRGKAAGKDTGPAFGAPIELLERSKKGAETVTRPDSGIYMDFADHDGDGDLDMVVGGYSHYRPKAPQLTAAQKERVEAINKDLAAIDEKLEAIYEAIDKAVQGLDEAAAESKREELFDEKREEISAQQKKRQTLQEELDLLEPLTKRESYVWLYENLAGGKVGGTK